MAQLTKAEFVAKWHGIFADNITRAISELDMRDFVTDIDDSFYNAADFEAPAASFSTITGNATDNASLVQFGQDIINTVRGGVAPEYNTLKKLYDFTVAQLATVATAAIDGGTPALRAKLIKVRGGTYAEWTAANPILAAKEPGYVTDFKVLLHGDGVSNFNTLWAQKPTTGTGSAKYFTSEAALNLALPPDDPARQAGDWALVQGTTAVTVWAWNPSTELWEDTEQEVEFIVDQELDPESENAVANKVVAEELDKKLDKTGVIEITQVNGLPDALNLKLENDDIYSIIAAMLHQGDGMNLIKDSLTKTITFKVVSGPSGTTDYNALSNKPSINGIELAGDVDSATLGISYNDLTDLPTPGATDYPDLTNKPSINGVELVGNKTSADLKLSGWLGTFTSLANLQTAHPTANGGDTATIDEGVTSKSQRYEFDVSDSQWVPVGSGAGMVEKNWKFATNTAESDPGNGNFRMDNANPTLVTKLFFSQTAQSSFDAESLFKLLKLGMTIVVQQSNNAAKISNFQISGTPTDNGTWWTIPVIVITPTPSLYDGSASCSVFFNFATSLVQNASETTAGIVEEGTQGQVNDPANTGVGETGAKLVVVINKLWGWWTYVLGLLFGFTPLTFSTSITYDLTGKKHDSKRLTGINAAFALNFTAGQNEDGCEFHIYAYKSIAGAVVVTLGGSGIIHTDGGGVTITTLSLKANQSVHHLQGKLRWNGTAIEIDWVVSDGDVTQTLSASTTDIPSVGLVNSELLQRHKQGGNAFGVAAVAGTTDAFDYQINRGGSERAKATATGWRSKGAGTGTGVGFQHVNSSDTQAVAILDNGLMKIGAGTPASNLDVAGSVSFGYRAITGARTLDVTDHIIDCTANTFTVTLPTAVGITGRRYVIKNTGAGVITIATTASQTIDGASTQSLATQYAKLIVVSNGANWIITG